MNPEQNKFPDNQKIEGLKQATSIEVEQVKSAFENQITQQKIHNILEHFDLEDSDNHYLNTLKTLNTEQLAIVSKLSKIEFKELLDKPQNQVLQILIQTQITNLESKANLTRSERIQISQLREELIAVENQKQKKQKETIDDIDATNEKLDRLEGILLSNPKTQDNPKIKILEKMFVVIDKNRNQKEMQKYLDEVISFLQEPGTIESIASSLGGVDSKDYLDFKNQILAVEPNLQGSFDRAEMKLLGSLAKIKLGTDDLTGVNLDNDILIKTEGNLIITLGDNTRNLSLTGSEYSLESAINPQYEGKILAIHNQATEKLLPLNHKINSLSAVLNIISQAQQNEINFKETKAQIKNSYPVLYRELGLDSHNSFTQLIFVIEHQKSSVEKTKEEFILDIRTKLELLVLQNTNEAKENDKHKKKMLEFLNSIGFDAIPQNKTNLIIDYLNKYPGMFGLQEPISFENASLGFDKDFGNKEITSPEKRDFIRLFNQMLGVNIVDENIANATTTISPEAIMQIQVLANKPVGYFMENLDKFSTTN